MTSVVALIMAGGKGTRFKGKTEKPMALFNDKPLIRSVIEAVKEAKRVREIYVAITDYTPKTAQEAKKALVKVISTDGNGYHADVQQAVKDANINCPVMIISSDLPLLRGEFLDEIIEKYESSGKPALTVLIPEEAFNIYGLTSVSHYEHNGKMYAVSGINIIDGQKILEEQEQEVVITSKPEAVFTVNSIKDLMTTKKYIKNNRV
ncbi:MAG: NTP transferase domain-containing protein [Ignavibacteriaceae bacterium]